MAMTPTNMYQHKVICVTGAGGSIGSEICRKLAQLGAREIRAVGHSEDPLYRIEKEINLHYKNAPLGPLVPILGSVGDDRLMRQVLAGVDIVIHAAAHKHVPLCEENPLEAITNNVGGTVTLMKAAADMNVLNFILVSTDKAVRPSSIMGKTKRACELFANYLTTRVGMNISVVRFGNVLNSAGSVLPLWREQIDKFNRITITDKRCTRFFMSIPEAVQLTLEAGTLGDGLYVLDMGKPRNIFEMAQELIADYHNPAMRAWNDMAGPNAVLPVAITETGLRPGEKLHEELSYGGDLKDTKYARIKRVAEPVPKTLHAHDFGCLIGAAHVRAKADALSQLDALIS